MTPTPGPNIGCFRSNNLFRPHSNHRKSATNPELSERVKQPLNPGWKEEAPNFLWTFRVRAKGNGEETGGRDDARAWRLCPATGGTNAPNLNCLVHIDDGPRRVSLRQRHTTRPDVAASRKSGRDVRANTAGPNPVWKKKREKFVNIFSRDDWRYKCYLL